MSTELTVKDRHTLSACETDIERGGRMVAEAFAVIQDKKLYRQYGTFESYCQERWGITARRAKQIASHERVIANLTNGGKVEPLVPLLTERATREISDLPPKTQEQVVVEATKGGVKPTAANLREARESLAPKRTAVSEFFDEKPSGTAAAPAGRQAKDKAGSGTDAQAAPAAGSKSDPFKTQRAKTVKTAEALMRAFEDMNELRKSRQCAPAVKSCKELIAKAKNW